MSTPTARDLEKALDMIGMIIGAQPNWKFIENRLIEALVAERASLPESVDVFVEYHVLQGSPAAVKALEDLRKWKAGA